MTKRTDGEYFDGLGVTQYEGKFNGGFELTEELGESMKYNDVHTFLVTCVVGAASFDENKKTGEIKRTNKLNVVAVKDIDSAAATQIDKILNGQVQQVPAPTYQQSSLTPVYGNTTDMNDDYDPSVEEEDPWVGMFENE